jgi:hypothetical protein
MTAANHRVSAPCTHRLAGARAPLRLRAERHVCSPLPPCWQPQTAGLKATPPSATALADARRKRAHRAATPALESNPHSAVAPLAPFPMARGFLRRGLRRLPSTAVIRAARHNHPAQRLRSRTPLGGRHRMTLNSSGPSRRGPSASALEQEVDVRRARTDRLLRPHGVNGRMRRENLRTRAVLPRPSFHGTRGERRARIRFARISGSRGKTVRDLWF